MITKNSLITLLMIVNILVLGFNGYVGLRAYLECSYVNDSLQNSVDTLKESIKKRIFK